MTKKRREKNQRNDKLTKIVLLVLCVFTLALLIMILINFGAFKLVQSALVPQKPIVIYGQCYAMFNTIIYQINNEEDCKKQCTDNCWVLKESYRSSQFVLTNNSCNICNCYCR